MAGIASSALDFVASNPFAVTLLVLLMLFIFASYLFLRKTVKEFRRGMEGP